MRHHASPGWSTCLRLAAIASLCLPAGLLPAAAPAAAAGAALFDESAVLPLVLEVPVRQLGRDRRAREPSPATLHFTDAGGQRVSLAVEVRTRGRSRLELCDYPPLMLEFARGVTTGTPFAGQRRYRLATQCRIHPRYRSYILLEQRIYEAYRLLAPAAFRTRLVEITYVDPAEPWAPRTRPGFLIEDIDDLARRVGLREQRVPAVEPEALDAAAANLLELFQFMIGNTDWSAHLPTDGRDECCHNVRVLAPREGAGGWVGVPFDFDQAGLIDAEYAAPSPAVGVRRVRQRIYRGLCSRNDQLPGSIGRFQAARPAIEALFAPTGGISASASRRALVYVEAFYAIIADPAQVQEKIVRYCRPDPEVGAMSVAGTPASGAAAASGSSAGRLP